MAAQNVLLDASKKDDEYASFSKRFWAWSIDRTIIDTSFTFLTLPLMVSNAFDMSGGIYQMNAPIPLPSLGSGQIWLLWVLVDWLYFASQESSRRSATLGKRMAGVIVLDQDGHRLTFLHASIRHFCKYLSILLLMTGFLVALFTKKKQALHDLLADTLVFKK